jgi:hypothetical protein
MASSDIDSRSMSEWQEARGILARFDNNLHDLRKYGFTFITGLLAVSGLLSNSGSTALTDPTKAVVLAVTLGLIVVLKLLDTQYGLYEEAAAIRARIIENRLNLDLTNDIAFLAEAGSWWEYVQALYYGFVALTALLGVAILWNDPEMAVLVSDSALIAAMLMWGFGQKRNVPLTDWSVDQKIVPTGGSVRITFTNLDRGDIREKGRTGKAGAAKAEGKPGEGEEDGGKPGRFKLSWEVIHHPEGKEIHAEEADDRALYYFDDFDWLWPTKDLDVGLYELKMKSERINPRYTRSVLRPETKKPNPKGGDDNERWLRMTIQLVPPAPDYDLIGVDVRRDDSGSSDPGKKK